MNLFDLLIQTLVFRFATDQLGLSAGVSVGITFGSRDAGKVLVHDVMLTKGFCNDSSDGFRFSGLNQLRQ